MSKESGNLSGPSSDAVGGSMFNKMVRIARVTYTDNDGMRRDEDFECWSGMTKDDAKQYIEKWNAGCSVESVELLWRIL